MDTKRLQQLAGITNEAARAPLQATALVRRAAEQVPLYSLLLIMANTLQEVASEEEINQAKLWRAIEALQNAAKSLM